MQNEYDLQLGDLIREAQLRNEQARRDVSQLESLGQSIIMASDRAKAVIEELHHFEAIKADLLGQLVGPQQISEPLPNVIRGRRCDNQTAALADQIAAGMRQRARVG